MKFDGGTAQKRGSSWQITISCGLDANGRQIRRTMTYKPKGRTEKQVHAEIQKAIFDFKEKAVNGDLYDGEKITFNEFVKTWDDEWCRKNVTPSNRECYLKDLKNHIMPEIGNMKISAVKTMHCQKIINSLDDSGLKIATVKKIFTAMRSVFKYAKRMKIIKSNPCDDVELPKTKIKKQDVIRSFNLDQSKRFLDGLQDTYQKEYGKRIRKDSEGNTYEVKGYTVDFQIPYQFRLFFTLACYSGCRRGELLALTWNDIDFENHIIDVNKAIAESKETGVYVKEPKTSSGYRKITLPSICFEMLNKWHEMELQLCINLSNKWEGKTLSQFEDQFLFIQENGEVMNPKTPSHKFEDVLALINGKIQKEAEQIQNPEEKEKKLSELLPKITLHELRHTASTLLVAQGMDIATISKRLGHSKISTTLNIYTHALPEKDKEASDMLERIYSDNRPMVHMETVKVSDDEKKVLERLRNADPDIQGLFMDMLEGKYSKEEIHSIVGNKNIMRS
jgi:integrase